MKKITLFFVVIIFSVNGFSQPIIQWEKSLGGTYTEEAYSVQQTSDSGYIVAGISESNDGDVTGHHGNGDYWIVKLNDSGIIQWQKSLGGTAEERAYSIQQTIDGGYIIAGRSQSDDGDVTGHNDTTLFSYDYWIVKINNSGTIQWQKSLGGNGIDEAYTIQQTTDQGYIIAGLSTSNDSDVTYNHGTNGANDYWIVKIDTIGNIQWQKSLGGSEGDVAYSIQQTTDGGFIIAGESNSNDGDITGHHGNTNCFTCYDYWVVKVDTIGNIQWQKSLGGTGDDRAYFVQQTFDSGYIVAGISSSSDGDITGHHGIANNEDYWIVKLDNFGNIQWQKSLGGSLNDRAYSIRQTADGGYVVAGGSWSDDGDVIQHNGSSIYIDSWIIKLDENGYIQWQKILGGTNTDAAYSIQQTADEGYIIAASSGSNDIDVTGNHGSHDYWIVKLAPYVGIEEQNIFSFINLFPNPATTSFTIYPEYSGRFTISEIEIYNTLGEKRLTPTLSKGEGVRVDVSSLPAGVYFVAVTDDKGNKITKRFIKM